MFEDVFCDTCGELLNQECICHLDETEEQEANSDFKFEYAFESITEINSSFKKKYPDY